MLANTKNGGHAAEAAALGFYYQTLYALLTLLERSTDDAAIAVEQVDDIQLEADGEALFIQLKHSVLSTPPPITIASRSLWRTLKIWIDVLPRVSLSETTFQLVVVAGILADSPLTALITDDASREPLVTALAEEAQRVLYERATAAANNKTPPHADRVDGCDAFLSLPHSEQLNLLRRIIIKVSSPAIGEIEERVAEHLQIVHPEQRALVARRLIQWWDREVVYSLCGKRERVLTRAELQEQLSVIIGDLEHDRLVADFETLSEPADYQPSGMLAQQINLVKGTPSDLSKAIREEWRAREQRSRWINEKPSMATVIGQYDLVLQEHWSDRHNQAAEECTTLGDEEKCASGLKILRWSHDDAPYRVRPIADGWNAPYYVRGSYQVLAINRQVGWHPNYKTLLGGEDDSSS